MGGLKARSAWRKGSILRQEEIERQREGRERQGEKTHTHTIHASCILIQTERHRETEIMMDVEGHKQRKLQREIGG